MRRICFVTNEIFPTTTGGAGFLIYNLSHALLYEGHRVILVLDLSKADFDRFQQGDRLNLPNPQNCISYRLADLCTGLALKEKDFLSRHTWDAYRIDAACRQVYQGEQPDLIEFVDYTGQSYYALVAKVCGLAYEKSHLAVRLHGSVELIDSSAPAKPVDFDRYTAYALERASWRLAESRLVAAPSYINVSYREDYPTPFGDFRLSPPPLLSYPTYQEPSPYARVVLFYGRLSNNKGADLFLEAALRFLAANPQTELQFALAGADSMEPPTPEWGNYQEYLESKIQPSLRNHFRFTGHLRRDELQALLAQVKFSVIPSYFESFCYAAYELRQSGTPVILSDLPVLRDGFSEGEDAIFFDGTPGGLAAQMERLDRDSVLRRQLARKPAAPPEVDLSYYLTSSKQSWINPIGQAAKLDLLALVLLDASRHDVLDKTLTSLDQVYGCDIHVVILVDQQPGYDLRSRIRLFGKTFCAQDRDGRPIVGSDLCTRQTLVVLRSGDQLHAEFIQVALETLNRQEQITFIGTSKVISANSGQWIDTHPLAAMLELAPLETASYHYRCVMRTPPGIALGDLLDERTQHYSEIDYLWRLESDQTCGVHIPAAWISQQAEQIETTTGAQLSHLLQKEPYHPRQQRLVNYLAMLVTSYPESKLPLQRVWASLSGDMPGRRALLDRSPLVRSGWRRRIYLRLSQGGAFSQRLLAGLSWGWFHLKKLR